jgi:hypothetical protein
MSRERITAPGLSIVTQQQRQGDSQRARTTTPDEMKRMALHKAYGIAVDRVGSASGRPSSGYAAAISDDEYNNIEEEYGYDEGETSQRGRSRSSSSPRRRQNTSGGSAAGGGGMIGDAPESALAEIDRLKNMMRERDRSIFKLKQEIGVMKQIERRQQRDLEQLQSLEEDAPKIIRLLKDELQSFKAKLKQSNAIRTNEERLVRQYSDRIRHLSERNSKYKKLLKERDLEAREFLTHELEAEKERSSQLEKTMVVSFNLMYCCCIYLNMCRRTSVELN